MGEISRKRVTLKVFPKGQVVIPIALRKTYDINIGDQLEAIPENEGILLKPNRHKLIRGSLTDRLFGLFNKYAISKPEPDKKDIIQAFEKGITEGYRE
jgi:AbrB family looped-hinge helix DNA binding protein